ncbi:MAG: SIS domain-containing protein [Candidatus Shapirobacteria bacterium]
MCGILAASYKEDCSLTDISRLIKNMEYRGYDSWGVVTVDEKTKLWRGLGVVDAKKIVGNSKLILAHTRWATHGGIKLKNCHPFSSCKKDRYLVHNGIVENYLDLKIKDHKYTSETDSEVMVHFLEKYENLETGIKNLAKIIKGKNSLVVLDKKHKGFVGYKYGSPLIIGYGDGVVQIVSDVGAFDQRIDKIYYLEDKEIVSIDNNRNIKIFDNSKNKVVKIKWNNFVQNNQNIVEGQAMYREILETKEVLKRINKEKKLILDFRKEILNSKEIILVGCGSASIAAEMGAKLIAGKLKKRASAFCASEVNDTIDSFDRKALIIVLSQSGESMDLIEVTEDFLSKGFRVVGLINNPLSTLGRMVNKIYPLLAEREVAVAATKSFTAMIYWFLKVVNIKEKILFNEKEALKLAKKFTSDDRLIIIGRNENLILAKEAALKLKETCYIQAEAIGGSELKHGALALIEKGVKILGIGEGLKNDCAEIKARGGEVITISNEEIINNLITIQLLSFFLATNRKINPDKPRNLAKSVTVR